MNRFDILLGKKPVPEVEPVDEKKCSPFNPSMFSPGHVTITDGNGNKIEGIIMSMNTTIDAPSDMMFGHNVRMGIEVLVDRTIPSPPPRPRGELIEEGEIRPRPTKQKHGWEIIG